MNSRGGDGFERGGGSVGACMHIHPVCLPQPIHPSIHSFTHSPIHSSIHSFIHSSIHPFTHSPIHSSIHPSIHSFIHPFIHSFIQPFIHSFIHPSRDHPDCSPPACWMRCRSSYSDAMCTCSPAHARTQSRRRERGGGGKYEFWCMMSL